MAKDNKVLYLAGGAVLAYLLVPKDVKEKVGESLNITLPSIGGYDFSDLLGGISLGGAGGLIPSIEMPKIDVPEILKAAIPENAGNLFPDGDVDLSNFVKGLFDTWKTTEGGDKTTTPTKAVTPTGTTPWDWLAGLPPVAQTGVALGGTGVGVYGAYKTLPLVVKTIAQVITPLANRIGQFIGLIKFPAGTGAALGKASLITAVPMGAMAIGSIVQPEWEWNPLTSRFWTGWIGGEGGGGGVALAAPQVIDKQAETLAGDTPEAPSQPEYSYPKMAEKGGYTVTETIAGQYQWAKGAGW